LRARPDGDDLVRLVDAVAGHRAGFGATLS
jgi:hypothetical protein